MSPFPNRIEPVSNVYGCFPTQTTDGFQVLQTEECEFLSMFLTRLWIIPASVLLEGFTGPLQHSAHHYLIHGWPAPTQRTGVWILTALCVPAVFQTGFTESMSAREHHWLAENMPTNWTWKVIFTMNTSGCHSFLLGFDDKAGSKAPPMSP